jgi:CRISPR/Cas system CSM-associated protein Csm4 (group 5 of RAMP superfamily)
MAEKVDSIKEILAPYPEFSHRFFQAVGNLIGRKVKPEDVVKDIFVASEGYLKFITGASRFGDAVKELFKKELINKEQKRVLEALHEFRSDADGAGHAGNSITPTEEMALWFLDTLVAQLRMIDKKYKNKS